MRQDGLVQQLHNAETIIQGYKTRQKIAGDSWNVYRSVSENEWDIRLTGLNTNSQYAQRWKVTYQIEGARKIPNAFAIFLPLVNTGIETEFFGTITTTPTGFNSAYEDDGHDPLSIYFMITAAHNWEATTNSYMNVRFRAISPYKGKIKFEALDT